MVETSSTIPLTRHTQVATISFEEHGRLNSRAKCPPLRVPSSTTLCVEKEVNPKVGETLRLPQGAESKAISDEQVLSPQDYSLPLYSPLLHDEEVVWISTNGAQWNLSSEDHLNSANLIFKDEHLDKPTAMAFQSQGTGWQEMYQDLSGYCQMPEFSTNMSENSRSSCDIPEDELNTPVISRDEFNFDQLWDQGSPIRFQESPVPWEAPEQSELGQFSMVLPTESIVSTSPVECIRAMSPTLPPCDVDTGESVHPIDIVDNSELTVGREETVDIDCMMIVEEPNEVMQNANSGVMLSHSSLYAVTPQNSAKTSNEANNKLGLNICIGQFIKDVCISTPEIVDTLDALESNFNILKYVQDVNEADAPAPLTTDPEMQPPAMQFKISPNTGCVLETLTDAGQTIKEENVVEMHITEPHSLDSLPHHGKKHTSPTRSKSAKKQKAAHSTTLDQPSTSYAVVKRQNSAASIKIKIKSVPIEPRRTQRQRKRVYDISDEEDDDPLYTVTPCRAKTRRLTDCSEDASASGSECYKYRELRDRNNEASRKSRQNRKQREEEMEVTKEKLEKENENKRMVVENLQKLVDEMKQGLFKLMAGNKEAT